MFSRCPLFFLSPSSAVLPLPLAFLPAFSMSVYFTYLRPTQIAQNHPSTSAAVSALAANSPQNGREINGVRAPSAHTVLNTTRTSTPCVPLDPTPNGEGCTAQARLQGFARLAFS
ncbi:hypothetical protein C8F04DRAFT_1108443, partial [Mycena alexandri]